MIPSLSAPTRRRMLGLLGAALLPARLARAEGLETLEGAAFGTGWRVVAPEGAGLGRLRPGIAAVFDDIDRQMSPWRADSVVSRFNAGPSGWQVVEPELRRVTGAALDLARASGGAFDPTVGPLVARWGFGPIRGGDAPDWRGVTLDARGLAKARGDLTLDLCGIAKGRALDLATGLVRAAGIDSMLFDLGGELTALGRHPSGRDWRVAVQHPAADRDAAAALRLPDGMAVATSGLAAQGYAAGTRTYGHIIDPATRAPADTQVLSVSVVAADAMTADGWATALFAAGPQRGRALAEAQGLAALFLVKDGDTLRQVTTGAIGEMLL